MHPSHKRIWIPGLIILAALAAVIGWAFSTSSRVYAKPELASGPLWTRFVQQLAHRRTHHLRNAHGLSRCCPRKTPTPPISKPSMQRSLRAKQLSPNKANTCAVRATAPNLPC